MNEAGVVGILNVGAGDVELKFNSEDPAERIRAGRIVRDMLRRGFALLVEVERDGEKRFERAIGFDEKTSRYIIADFDPVVAEERDAWDEAGRERRREEKEYGESIAAAPPPSGEGVEEVPDSATTGGGRKRGRKPGRKAVDAKSTRAVAVGRSAGG